MKYANRFAIRVLELRDAAQWLRAYNGLNCYVIWVYSIVVNGVTQERQTLSKTCPFLVQGNSSCLEPKKRKTGLPPDYPADNFV